MKPLLSFRVVGVPAQDIDIAAVRTKSSMLRAFHSDLVSIVLAKAREYAPGGMKDALSIEAPHVENGMFVASITAPEKYASVEFGIDHDYIIEPTMESKSEYGNEAVLVFAGGEVHPKAHVRPREGQHPIERAMEESMDRLVSDMIEAAFYDIA